jgi:hypothetical protein
MNSVVEQEERNNAKRARAEKKARCFFMDAGFSGPIKGTEKKPRFQI